MCTRTVQRRNVLALAVSDHGDRWTQHSRSRGRCRGRAAHTRLDMACGGARRLGSAAYFGTYTNHVRSGGVKFSTLQSGLTVCLVPQRHHPVWNQPDNEHDEEEPGATGFLELDDIQPRTRRQLFLCSISIMDSVVDHFQFTKCLLLEVRTHYESAQDTHHCVHLRLTLRSFVHPTFQDFTFDSLVVELMCARTVARRKCVSTMILECHSTYRSLRCLSNQFDWTMAVH